MHVLCIDQSSIYNKQLWGINSANYMPRRGFDLRQEYALNYLRYISWLKHIFKPDLTYFCRDSKPYWRTGVVDDFYNQPGEVVISRQVNDAVYYLDVDRIKYAFFQRDGGWVERKLTKKDLEDIPVTFELKLDREHFAREYPSLWEKIEYRIPGYKKQRHINRVWKWEFDQDEFMIAERSTNYHAAGFLKGKVLELEGLEADDLAYVVSTLHPNDAITYVTVDGDWRQLISKKKQDTLWQPKERVFLPKSGVSLYMWQKIFCGDSSDEYRGVGKIGGPLYNQQKAIEKLFSELGGAGMHALGSDKTKCDGRYERNRKIALLNQMPEDLKHAATTLAKTTPVQEITIRPEHWGWNDMERDNLRAAVLVDKLMVGQLRKACIKDWETSK